MNHTDMQNLNENQQLQPIEYKNKFNHMKTQFLSNPYWLK